MSSDEALVTITSVMTGPVLWSIWLVRMSRVQPLHHGRQAAATIGIALLACAALILFVLDTMAADDVVDAPVYQFMYLVIGLAWLRALETTFPYFGVSPRDDVFERGNRAAALAVAGALIAISLCYAGGNIGNGPGWWVVLFSAALATGVLMLVWAALALLTPVIDSVTIDRDPAAGVRLGTCLTCCGLILGRGVAGDWESAASTVRDFIPAIPAVAAILIAAIVIEPLARPTAERPYPSRVAFGLLPSALYLLIAGGGLWQLGWPA